MYNVKLYRNTGFNAINIPDSPSRLPEQNAYTCAALDIYQARELSQFSVRIAPGKYTDIQDADYLYLQNDEVASDFAYYSIQNITMTSNDVAVLSVTMDYILSAGGVNNLEFLDGMCERHHVALADDIFGKYDEADPYLTPAEMLKIEAEEPDFVGQGTADNIILLESTVSLRGLWEQVNTPNLKPLGITFFDPDNNDDKVTVPVPSPVKTNVNAWMDYPGGRFDTTLPKVAIQGVNIQPPTGDVNWVPDALSYIRSLGLEDAIIAQYAIPSFMVHMGSQHVVAYGDVRTLEGANVQVPSTFPYIHAYNRVIRNNRVYYGDNCKYYIVSVASGNSAEFLPEEIYEDGDVSPTVEMRVDPRPSGAPYFRFETYRHETDPKFWFTNAVKGLQWQNVPLVYQGGSGSLINQYKFNAQQAINKEQLFTSLSQNTNSRDIFETKTRMGRIGSQFGVVGDVLSQNWGGAISSAADMAEGYLMKPYYDAQYEITKDHLMDSYMLARQSELKSLLISNNVVAPSINFPISESIRDYVGNTCVVYRTYYSDNDVARIDKILTMFGYRHTTPIENSLLTNRSKFNYIQAVGVSVKNEELPKWMRDGIALQFAAGLRIWHQLPDIACYTDGSNI